MVEPVAPFQHGVLDSINSEPGHCSTSRRHCRPTTRLQPRQVARGSGSTGTEYHGRCNAPDLPGAVDREALIPHPLDLGLQYLVMLHSWLQPLRISLAGLVLVIRRRGNLAVA